MEAAILFGESQLCPRPWTNMGTEAVVQPLRAEGLGPSAASRQLSALSECQVVNDGRPVW